MSVLDFLQTNPERPFHEVVTVKPTLQWGPQHAMLEMSGLADVCPGRLQAQSVTGLREVLCDTDGTTGGLG